MGKFNLDSKLGEIAKDEKAREIVESFLPGRLIVLNLCWYRGFG